MTSEALSALVLDGLAYRGGLLGEERGRVLHGGEVKLMVFDRASHLLVAVEGKRDVELSMWALSPADLERMCTFEGDPAMRLTDLVSRLAPTRPYVATREDLFDYECARARAVVDVHLVAAVVAGLAARIECGVAFDLEGGIPDEALQPTHVERPLPDALAHVLYLERMERCCAGATSPDEVRRRARELGWRLDDEDALGVAERVGAGAELDEAIREHGETARGRVGATTVIGAVAVGEPAS